MLNRRWEPLLDYVFIARGPLFIIGWEPLLHYIISTYEPLLIRPQKPLLDHESLFLTVTRVSRGSSSKLAQAARACCT